MLAFCLALVLENNYKTYMFIIKYKKIFIGISVALVLFSIASLFVFGLKVGIDFKGGAITEVKYSTTRPTQEALNKDLATLNFGAILLQPTGDLGYILKSRSLTDAEHTLLLKTISPKIDLQNTGKDKKVEMNTLTEVSFNSIGPSVGSELTRKAIVAIILISLAIICFIAFVFRKVSNPISSWKYGVIAIVTLLHDVAVPVGIFVVLSHYYGAELDTLFVVAVLTILGLSVSDTIVIFDRIRENLRNVDKTLTKNKQMDFAKIVGESIEQSYARSIATSLTVILVLLALFFFGPVSTKYFALMLTAGMFFGTYSSIFLASPLLVLTQEWQEKRNK